jgi:hypothetical protein
MLTSPYTSHQPPTWLKVTQVSTHIILLIAIATSTLLIVGPWLNQHLHCNQGRIKLPAEEVAQTRKDLLSKQFLNHIEDIPRNGDPVDLPGFWKKVSVGHPTKRTATMGM